MIDPGGTNYGIMQCTYDSYRISHKLKKQSVRDITMDEVYDLYYYNYYLRSGADTLKPCLSFVHFDTAINCGIGQAQKFIRKVNMIPDKDNAAKYITLRDQLYKWLRFIRTKNAF
jgi:lysozyme family protein